MLCDGGRPGCKNRALDREGGYDRYGQLPAELPAPDGFRSKLAVAPPLSMNLRGAASVQTRRFGGRWLVNRRSVAARARLFHGIAF
jgi:hypothetical protein